MFRKIARRCKSKLRYAYYRMHHHYARWRRSFDTEDFARMLEDLGIEAGDTLLVHSEMSGFEGYTGKVTDLIAALQKQVGPEGTILMPTQPFRDTAVAYVQRGELFDVKRTPSQMGLITEVFRRSPGVVRSVHPTHPVAVWGKDIEAIIRDNHLSRTPCGSGTPYARFGERNGKILLLGTGLNVLTYYHSLEEGLEPLLPENPFTDETFEIDAIAHDRSVVHISNRLFEPELSRRRDMHGIVPYFKKRGVWRDARLGTLHAILIGAQDLKSVVYEMAENNEYCYLPA